jgi:hypothetical protein
MVLKMPRILGVLKDHESEICSGILFCDFFKRAGSAAEILYCSSNDQQLNLPDAGMFVKRDIISRTKLKLKTKQATNISMH